MNCKGLIYIVLLLLAVVWESCSSRKETFEAGNKTFLLNGEPFVIKAAEMHYPRIPKEYWEHRI
jgi:beta-galactosidase